MFLFIFISLSILLIALILKYGIVEYTQEDDCDNIQINRGKYFYNFK